MYKFLILFAVVLGCAALATGDDITAMDACTELHSLDTCFNLLHN